jgi:hypothetical protein
MGAGHGCGSEEDGRGLHVESVEDESSRRWLSIRSWL